MEFIEYRSQVGTLYLTLADEAIVYVGFQQPAEAWLKRWLHEKDKQPTSQLADQIHAQLDEYFAGHRTTFDLPLAVYGTDYQKRVYAALQDIPLGKTVSYGELARRVGSGPRAVGQANHRNPISLIIPCHRVIGANGDLIGYGGGLDRKQWLLKHEKALI